MKVKKLFIPADSLVNKYLPGDYDDVFACELINKRKVTPDEIQIRTWGHTPGWFKALMNLRNALVHPFGLQGDNKLDKSKSVEAIIKHGERAGVMSLADRTEKETILLLSDKHLDAYCSAYVTTEGTTQLAMFITLVHFHNTLGKVYFFFIKPFHKMIVRSMLKSVLTYLTKDQHVKTS